MMYEDLLRVGGDFNHNHWKLNIGNRIILPRQSMTVQGVMASHPIVVFLYPHFPPGNADHLASPYSVAVTCSHTLSEADLSHNLLSPQTAQNIS